MKIFHIIFFFFVFSSSFIDAAKILIFLPLPIWSHYMQFENLWETLVERGHDVTLYSSFSPKIKVPNFKHVNITLTKTMEFFDTMNHFEFKSTRNPTFDFFNDKIFTQNTLSEFGIAVVKETFEHPKFKDLLNSKDHYDIVITESFFGQEPFVMLGHKFKAPVIAESSFGTPNTCLLFMGNPNLYSYMPDYKFIFPNRMNFIQRLQNTLLGLHAHILEDLYYYPKQDEQMREVYPDKTIPYIKTLLKNISVTFIYSDIIMEYPRAQVSNLVHVGGIHLENNKLPKDLEDIMSGSPKGIVYVSFGSIIKPNKMSDELKTILLEAFSKIELTILWKWTGEPIKNLPSNVLTRSWLPQQDILAHPNCRLFISHGGLNSALEAIHYGVPVVGISMYGDQAKNVQRLVDLGMGVDLSYFNITQNSLVWAANTVLNDRRYKMNAIKASQRFNDRPDSPLQIAVWWIEYVLRHHGAPHLRSAYVDLSWTEFLLLDVVAFVLAILLLVLYLLYKILKLITGVLLSLPGKDKSSNKQNKKKKN